MMLPRSIGFWVFFSSGDINSNNKKIASVKYIYNQPFRKYFSCVSVVDTAPKFLTTQSTDML